MRIEKPLWISHSLKDRVVPIYSVDIHPGLISLFQFVVILILYIFHAFSFQTQYR